MSTAIPATEKAIANFESSCTKSQTRFRSNQTPVQTDSCSYRFENRTRRISSVNDSIHHWLFFPIQIFPGFGRDFLHKEIGIVIRLAYISKNTSTTNVTYNNSSFHTCGKNGGNKFLQIIINGQYKRKTI